MNVKELNVVSILEVVPHCGAVFRIKDKEQEVTTDNVEKEECQQKGGGNSFHISKVRNLPYWHNWHLGMEIALELMKTAYIHSMDEAEKNRLTRSIVYPSLFVALLWAIKIFEIGLDLDIVSFGLYPRAYSGLIGIVTCPLIHSSFEHLFSNSIPLLILGGITFYFYRPIAFSVFFWVYLMGGVWLWAAGRPAYHIGASGLVYGFASFLFFSGIFRKERTSMALSLIVVFLYGSMVWGIFPLESRISWESHLLGSLAGFITAFYFRKEGPQSKKFEWNEEEDNGDLLL